jgi:nucleoside 2-deoxyribosyltransferase
MLRVYLSGCLAGRYATEVTAERAEATKILAQHNLRAVDPAESQSILWGSGKKAKVTKKMKRKLMATMVKRDKALIRKSDILLVLTADIISDGTFREMDFAQRCEIPVVIVSPKRYTEELMGWTNILVPKDHTFPTVQKAASFIRRKYVQDYENFRNYFNMAVRKAPKDK